MRMDDETLKRILQEASEYDADCIMKEVNSNLNLQEVVIPADMDANIKEEIDRIKAAQAQEQEKQAQEEQELIRLGKLYKKKRARNKYIILIAAVVCALGIGTISFGDGKKVFTEIKRALGDREQTVVNSGDEDRHIDRGVLSEENAYEEINEKFGFVPVRMLYLPKGMEFVESIIEDELQNIRIYYEETNSMICYTIWPNYRDTSLGMDLEDEVINEYSKEVQGVDIFIKEHKIEDSKDTRWRAEFIYNDVQYYLMLSGVSQQEVEKIIENLYFL